MGGLTQNPRAYYCIVFVILSISLYQNCSPFKSTDDNSTTLSENFVLDSLSIDGDSEVLDVTDTVSLKGRCINGRIVKFTGDIAPFQLECQDGRFDSTIRFIPPDGIKNIVVEQVDENGRTLFASRSFKMDSTPPALMVLSPSDNLGVQNNVLIEGLCENELTIKISLNNNPSPQEVICVNGAFTVNHPLPQQDGQLTLSILQEDRAGNSTMISKTIHKDTVAPVVAISSPTENQTVSQIVAVSGTCESGGIVNIKGDGVQSPIKVNCNNDQFSTQVVLTNGVGAKTLLAEHIDGSGNIGLDTVQVNLSTSGPQIEIQSPTEGAAFQNSLQLSGTCQNGLPVEVSISGGSSNNTSTINCTNSTFSVQLNLNGNDGEKNLILSQTNNAGQKGAASRSFIKDTQAPALVLVSPTKDSFVSNSLQISGSCEKNLDINLSGVSSQDQTIACATGTFSKTITVTKSDGPLTLQLQQQDLAKNSTIVTREVTKDTLPPTLSIQLPATGTEAELGLNVSGACESPFVVLLTGSGMLAPVQTNCVNNQFAKDILFSDGDGSKNIRIEQTDAAGNFAQYDRNFIKMTVELPLDGAALYAKNCASCHGSLANSIKRNASSQQISNAIMTIGNMNFLKFLSNPEVDAIAQALSDQGDGSPVACSDSPLHQSSPTSRRLTKAQYFAILEGIFKEDLSDLKYLFPNDIRNQGFSNQQGSLVVSRAHVTAFKEISQKAVDKISQFNNWRNSNFPSCSELKLECFNDFLDEFGLVAFRRPLNSQEKQLYERIFIQYQEEGENFDSTIKALISAILQSPQFLYRLESIDPDDSMILADQYTLASRLSFLVWQTGPDERLLNLASQGALDNDSTILSEVRRMLQDPKAKTSLRFYISDWLGLDNLGDADIPAGQYPELNTNLLLAMKESLLKHYEELVFTEDRPLTEALSDKHAYLNSSLGSLYGLNIQGSGLQKVDTTNLPGRTGVLSHPGILFVPLVSDHPSIVQRGIYMNETFFCQDIPPAPAGVANDLILPVAGQSQRQQLEAHRSEVACASCHALLDGPGLAFDNFDTLGKYRPSDTSGNPLYSFGDWSLDSQKITWTNNQDFINNVENNPSTKNCFIKKSLQFHMGRSIASEDQCVTGPISESLSQQNFQYGKLLEEIAVSKPFKTISHEGE